ncbi:MAG: peptidase U62 [Cyanobacteria bacterium HKST-UBA01]|nr:peptidase U62 [Cyanobacteria bacterium HKST-UBA01]
MKKALTKSIRALLTAAILITSCCPAFAQEQENESKIIAIMEKELKRSFDKLKNAGDAPLYYLGYRLYETTTDYISAEYGARTSDDFDATRRRILRVDLRVGSRQLDNTHKVRDQRAFSFDTDISSYLQTDVPLDDNELALRHALWLRTDKAFRTAQQQYAAVIANKDVNVKEEDSSDDFSQEDSQEFVGEEKTLEFDRKKWCGDIKELSAIYKKYSDIYSSSVAFTASLTRRWLVNSEGTRIYDSRTDYGVYTTAQAKADDGMNLWLYDDIEATSVGDLPGREKLESFVTAIADNLTRLRTAPKAKPFAGPAILRSKAAGVFFHEVFGHRMEGHRQKNEKEGRTFTKSIDKKVMPDFISVLDDPTLKELSGVRLNGTYKFDDEGVPAQKVTLVDKGVLKTFLLSRSPVKGFPRSNGHGRCSPSRNPVARMGNLIVKSENTVSYDELREKLVETVKKQGKEYGLIFDDIAGGYTLTSTSAPQVYSLQPLVVTKVFADDRPDELVRGVKIVGTPLTALEKILLTSDQSDSFNGVCGAESGSVPVSASSPDLLVETLEVELKESQPDKPPLLKPPYYDKESESKR